MPKFSRRCIVALSMSLLTPLLLAETAEDFRVLVFSKTAGFRHGSIEAGVKSVQELGKSHGFAVEATEDSEQFNPENLERFQAVVFLNTTGTVFDENQREAFKGYIQGGGGYVGIHSATDTEYDWEWYGKLAGAYFASHPAVQNAEIKVEDNTHPATRHLDESLTRRDEWYDFRENPRENVQVLLSLVPDSYEGRRMDGEDHPISWYHEFDGGRAFYTGFGHTSESFSEEVVLKHLLGAIQWAAGQAEVGEQDAD